MKSSFAYLITEEAFEKYQKNIANFEMKTYKNRNEFEREAVIELLNSSPRYTVDQAVSIATCFINRIAEAKKPFETQEDAIQHAMPCFFLNKISN